MTTIIEIEKRIEVLYNEKDDFSIPKEKRLATIKQTVESIGGDLDNILLQITNNANLGSSQNLELQQDYLRGYDKPYNVRAYLHYLHGKLLNAQTNYDKQSENLLSKAIRLEPNLLEAWNALGECYWKKDDLKSAMNCFLAVINHSSTQISKMNSKSEVEDKRVEKIAKKIALRRLSMVLRQISPSEGNANEIESTRKKNVVESVAKAREAVEIDPLDSFSWYILGNGYLALFFSVSSANSDMNFGDLRKALAAYQQAVSFLF